MDPITAQTMIKLAEHYKQLLAEKTKELAEEKKKSHMYEIMAMCYGDIDCSSQDGVCAECDQLCFSVTPMPVGFEYQTFVDKRYNYKTCQKCKELTCTVCCNDIAWGIDYSTDDYDCGKCVKCIVLDGGSTVVRD